jgi:hypothetical protein
MFGSEIIDVVIGMIFVFLVLSLVCSAANEIIESWLNKRADYLEKGIKELLTDHDGTGYLKDVYRHPLVAGLFRDKYGAPETGWREGVSPRLLAILKELGLKKTRLPSYIPAQNFALALMDIVLDTSAATSPATSPDIKIVVPPERSLGAVNALPQVADGARNETIKALEALVKAADGNPAKVRENIENWYNSSMDRVSGWYKRRTQVIILILGFFLTVFLNADSIAICKSLSTDRALRSSLVASAGEYAKIDALNSKPETAASPAPAASPSAKTSPTVSPKSSPGKQSSEPCDDDPSSPRCKLDTEIAKIRSLGLPIGWDSANPVLVPPMSEPKSWFLKLLGWLITACAISLGAPFWFDLLNKFMIVRATVKPKEKSPEEPSKS